MGIDQVGTTTMDVDLRTKVFEGHRRALDVPAGTSIAPGTLPARFARNACLPEHEVERVLLAWILRIAAALGRELDHLLTTEPAEATVIDNASHPEIDVAVALVGVALRLEPGDQRDDLRNRLARFGEHVGGQHVESLHVALVEGGFLDRKPIPRGAELSRPPTEVILEVRHVLDRPDC